MEYPKYLFDSKKNPVRVKSKKEAENYDGELRVCPGMWDKEFPFDVVKFGKVEKPKRGRKKKVEDGDSEGHNNGKPETSQDNRNSGDS